MRKTCEKVIKMVFRESGKIKTWLEIDYFLSQFLKAVKHIPTCKTDVKQHMMMIDMPSNLSKIFNEIFLK